MTRPLADHHVLPSGHLAAEVEERREARRRVAAEVLAGLRCPTCRGAEYIRTIDGKHVCPTCRGSGLGLPPVMP